MTEQQRKYRIRKLKEEIKRLRFLYNFESRTEQERYCIQFYISKLEREVERLKSER